MTTTNEKIYNVRNRSAGMVVYRVPEMNVRRVFSPGEVKRITHAELEALSFRPGGKELMKEYLQIKNAELLEEMNIHAEPEYYMDEEQVKELLISGSLEAFLDALDFAPEGVIDMIKDFSVSLPLGDYNKRKALLDKFGFDVDAAIKHMAPDEEQPAAVAPTRRTQPNIAITDEAPARRESTTKYNVLAE